jgi:hypothetical protein
MPARVLKARCEIWRAEAARIARGPKRAPAFYQIERLKVRGGADSILSFSSFFPRASIENEFR